MFLVKKDLLISFMKITMETKMFKCQKNNSSDKKSDREVSDFLSSEGSCDASFRSNQQEVFCENKCSAKICSRM